MTCVVVPIADGSEEMEAVIIIDVLRRAGIVVRVAGLTGEPIVASRNVRLIPDCSIAEVTADACDAVVLPGGNAGTEALAGDERVIELLKAVSRQGKLVAAICAAPKILLKAGLLDQKRVTSYPGALDPQHSGYEYCEDLVVKDGQVVTSRGPGTALDFSLFLVECLEGVSVRHKVEAPLMRP
jgi:4-methyl-5(b-hydroxyethyl)-thiazole monophosphate biosynthesis